MLRVPRATRGRTEWHRCPCTEPQAPLPELLFQRRRHQIQLRVGSLGGPKEDATLVVVFYLLQLAIVVVVLIYIHIYIYIYIHMHTVHIKYMLNVEA